MVLPKYAEFYVWAENRLIPLVDSLTDEEYARELSGPKRSIKNLLVHWVATYMYYFDIKTPFSEFMTELNDFSPKQLTTRWQELLTRFSSDMKADERSTIDFPLGPDKVLTAAIEDYYLAFTDHSTYHRGQLMSFLKTIGKEGINTDYFTYLTS